MASDKALSWVFAEEFVEENELLAQAREAATDLGFTSTHAAPLRQLGFPPNAPASLPVARWMFYPVWLPAVTT